MTVLSPVVMVKMYYGTWQNDLLCLHVEKLVTDEKLLCQEDYTEVHFFISYARGRKVF
jgi:hypothetical protein